VELSYSLPAADTHTLSHESAPQVSSETTTERYKATTRTTTEARAPAGGELSLQTQGTAERTAAALTDGLEWLREIEPAFDEYGGGGEDRGAAGAPAGIASRLRSPVARACWRRHAPADKLIQGVLDAGYAIEFIGGVWPGTHHDDRPLGGDAQAQAWTRSALAEMLSCGAVRTWADASAEMQEAGLRTGSRPAVTMPVFTIHKPSSTPEDPKFRFVHDCRWLNDFLTRKPFKLLTLKYTVEVIDERQKII